MFLDLIFYILKFTNCVFDYKINYYRLIFGMMLKEEIKKKNKQNKKSIVWIYDELGPLTIECNDYVDS